MNGITTLVIKSTLLLLLVFVYAEYSSAQEDCSNKNLEGGFGFIVSGQNVILDAQFAMSGKFVADGKGNVAGIATASTGGQIDFHVPFEGTYTIGPDCTGSSILSVFGGPVNLEFVLVDNGREVMIIASDQGTVEFGTAKKQSAASAGKRKNGATNGAERHTE